MNTSKAAKENQIGMPDLDPALTIPISVRVPARVAFQLYLYAERMNTSAGKLLTSLLEDTMPAFTKGSKEGWSVRLRSPQVYQAMQDANLLTNVNPQEVQQRMLQRAEGSGARGRPKKVGKHRGQKEEA